MTDLSTDQRIRAALDYDPLAEAERATGKHWSQSDTTGFLGMALALESGRHKSEVLRQADDTHMSQKLGDWLGVVERLGFDLLSTEDIPGTRDKLRIFWRPGVLLCADSYFEDASVNGANAYLNFRGPRQAMYRTSNGLIAEVDGQHVWECGFDAREGMRFTLETMEKSGEILPKWIKHPFLWLLHYQDTKDKDYDYNAINAARIAKLPKHVREAMGDE